MEKNKGIIWHFPYPDHAFMPIEIHAVTKEEFEEWVEKAKEEFASIDFISEQPIKVTAVMQDY